MATLHNNAVPSIPAGGATRGVFAGGVDPSYPVTNIVYITIQTLSGSTAFGSLSVTTGMATGVSAAGRGVIAGGYTTNSMVVTKLMTYITILSGGNSITFGNLPNHSQSASGFADATRGVFVAGQYGIVDGYNTHDDINYITIATTGNASAFGTLARSVNKEGAGCADATRGITGGGTAYVGGWQYFNNIDYVTIQTTGNSTDFGDLDTGHTTMAACADATRGVFAGGYDAPTDLIQYVTIQTTGNATSFGILGLSQGRCSGLADNTRGVFGFYSNMHYITIATTGNSNSFGNFASNYDSHLNRASCWG